MLENLDVVAKSSWMHLRSSYGKAKKLCTDYQKKLDDSEGQLVGMKAMVTTAEEKVKVVEGRVVIAEGRIHSVEDQASKLKARVAAVEEELRQLRDLCGDVCVDVGGYMCAKSTVEMIKEYQRGSIPTGTSRLRRSNGQGLS